MKTRFKDTEDTLRVRLSKTCILLNTGYSFFNEEGSKDKGGALVSAVVSKDGETIDISINLNGVKKLK